MFCVVVEPQAPPLPACGESIGGLRPPFLALRTPMRSIGYGAKRAGEGDCLQAEYLETPPPPPPPPPPGGGEGTPLGAALNDSSCSRPRGPPPPTHRLLAPLPGLLRPPLCSV